MQSNGWPEWKRHVLKELERLEHIEKDLHKIALKTATLEVKASIWGVFGGVATILVFILVEYVKR